MNKKELVDAIAEKTGMNKKESRKLLNVIIGIVIEAVSYTHLTLPTNSLV